MDDWSKIIALIISMYGMMRWFRSDTHEHLVSMDKRIDSMDKKIEVMRIETNAMIQSIHQEMKDFHGRMYAIEERNKGK